MTNAHSTLKNDKTKTAQAHPSKTSIHRYTVGYVSVRHQDKATYISAQYSKHPALHLKGNWLNELGFTTGQAVTVTAKEGKLIVEIDA